MRAERDATQSDEAPEEEQPSTEEPSRPSFRLPNFGEDLRLLPTILTSRRMMVVPPLLLLLGFVLTNMMIGGALPGGVGKHDAVARLAL